MHWSTILLVLPGDWIAEYGWTPLFALDWSTSQLMQYKRLFHPERLNVEQLLFIGKEHHVHLSASDFFSIEIKGGVLSFLQ